MTECIKLLAFLVCSLLYTGTISVSSLGATTLDFEEFNNFNYHFNLPTNYGGLTWDTYQPDYYGTNLGNWAVNNITSYSEAHSGSNYLFNHYGPNNLGFSFNSQVNNIDAWFASVNTSSYTKPSPIQLIGYVGTIPTYYSQLLYLYSTPQNLSLTGNNDITRVVVHAGTEIGGWYSMDDLHFTNAVAPVPEPSTFFLLGAGLSGLAFWRRKTKK